MTSATHSSEKSVQDYIKIENQVDKIVLNIKEVAQSSTSNARSVEDISSAAEHLNALTEELNNVLNKFKT